MTEYDKRRLCSYRKRKVATDSADAEANIKQRDERDGLTSVDIPSMNSFGTNGHKASGIEALVMKMTEMKGLLSNLCLCRRDKCEEQFIIKMNQTCDMKIRSML